MLEKTSHILELFAIETAEFLAPIVYSITITMLYYGPNSKHFGGVGGSFWAFKKIEDLARFQSKLVMMAFIDFTSAIISGCALWIFCSANFLKEGYKMMKVFLPMFCVIFAYISTAVS